MSSTAAKSKRKVKVLKVKALKPKTLPRSTPLLFVSIASVLAGVGIFLFTFGPVIKEEVRYNFTSPEVKAAKGIIPVDSNFGIIIPKIGANSKVVGNVDPFNEREYNQALAKGIAHAMGTAYPGQSGNGFFFAHSAGNFYEANQFNAIFYLLTKLEKGDSVELYYKGDKFNYTVTETKIVNADAVAYLKSDNTSSEKTITLMTCWPPGTSLQRFIVTAKLTP